MTDAKGVREYAEGLTVQIGTPEGEDRLVVHAMNDGGYNCTDVDLLDLLAYVRREMPEVWGGVEREGIIESDSRAVEAAIAKQREIAYGEGGE